MSDIALRQAIEADWPRLVPSIPLITTINEEADPPEDVWATVAYDSTVKSHQTMGSNPWIEEQGSVTFIVCAKSGMGDDEVAAAATTISNAWDSWLSPDGMSWAQMVGAPMAPDPESRGTWYRLTVTLDYRHQSKRSI